MHVCSVVGALVANICTVCSSRVRACSDFRYVRGGHTASAAGSSCVRVLAARLLIQISLQVSQLRLWPVPADDFMSFKNGNALAEKRLDKIATAMVSHIVTLVCFVDICIWVDD